jgi:hypothetical protein
VDGEAARDALTRESGKRRGTILTGSPAIWKRVSVGCPLSSVRRPASRREVLYGMLRPNHGSAAV